MSAEPSLGWTSPELKQELPGLRIATMQASLAPRVSPGASTPDGVRERLDALSDRFNGSKAVNLRREPVTAAYRVFFRHIGLDPDLVHTPMEAAVLERMLDGAFLPSCLLADVLLIAMLDTSVPAWALDAQRVEGQLGIRTSREGEALGGGGDGFEVDSSGHHESAGTGVALGEHAGGRLDAGQLVVVDSHRALALLFSQPVALHRPARDSRRLLLYALQVNGVPWLAVEESLWTARTALEAV